MAGPSGSSWVALMVVADIDRVSLGCGRRLKLPDSLSTSSRPVPCNAWRSALTVSKRPCTACALRPWASAGSRLRLRPPSAAMRLRVLASGPAGNW